MALPLLLLLALRGPAAAAAASVWPLNLPAFASHFRNGTEIQRGINAAIAVGAAEYVLPAGDFLFGTFPDASVGDSPQNGGVSLLVAGARGLRVSGAGANATALWFAPGFGVDVQGCANVTLEGFSVDTVQPGFSQGVLLEALDVAAGTADIGVDAAAFPLPSDPALFNQTCPDGSPGACGEIKVVFWDPDTRRILGDQQMGNPLGNVVCRPLAHHDTVAATMGNTSASDGTGADSPAGPGSPTPASPTNAETVAEGAVGTQFRCVLQMPQLDPSWEPSPPAGTLVTVSPRLWASKFAIPTFYKGTITAFNCSRVTFQDIDVFGAADMVFVENLGDGANTYRRVRVTRRPEALAPPGYAPRLLAANLDAFHSMSARAGPLVEDSEFGFLADDFINIHNRLLPLGRLDIVAGGAAAGVAALAAAEGAAAGAGQQLSTAWVLDVGNVPSHGYRGFDPAARCTARCNCSNPYVSHTLDFVQAGDALSLYRLGDSEDDFALLGIVVATGAPVPLAGKENASAAGLPPMPPALAACVEPDAAVWYAVPFDAASATLPPDPTSLGAFTALVQVEAYASAGAVVRRNYFHDSYNNVGRFASSDMVYAHNTVERAGDGVHVSYDIAGLTFLEGSLGRRNLTVSNNTFAAVRGCGHDRAGNKGCPHACANVSCVFAHVDPALERIVKLDGNRVSPTVAAADDDDTAAMRAVLAGGGARGLLSTAATKAST